MCYYKYWPKTRLAKYGMYCMSLFTDHTTKLERVSLLKSLKADIFKI